MNAPDDNDIYIFQTDLLRWHNMLCYLRSDYEIPSCEYSVFFFLYFDIDYGDFAI